MKKSYLPEDFWLKTIRCSYSNIIKIWLQKLSQNQLEMIKVSHLCFYLFFIFVISSVKKKLRLLDCLISFWQNFLCLFILSAYNTRETRSQYVFNRFLAKINGIQWFRINRSNFINYQILKLFEQLQQYCKGKSCSKLCILLWAIIS